MKPAPKHTTTVCTACDQAWEKHFPAGLSAAARKRHAVTLDDCVRVLKAELARSRFQPNQISGATGITPLQLRGNTWSFA